MSVMSQLGGKYKYKNIKNKTNFDIKITILTILLFDARKNDQPKI